MNWLARQSLARALLIAAAWPLALCVYVAAVVASLLLRDGTFFVDFRVSGWPALALLVLGPSACVLVVWALARWRHDPAT